MKSSHQGIKRILYALGYSWKGCISTWKNEAAFRQEVWLLLLLTPLAIWLADSLAEFVALISVLLLVLIVELINSAIESVVDRIGDEYHELSGRAKDQGSAAVLLAILIASAVWLVVIYSKF